MKTVLNRMFLFALMIAGLLAASCSNDDDAPPTPPKEDPCITKCKTIVDDHARNACIMKCMMDYLR